MGRVGASITKTMSFRGVAQEVSNTYYYEFTGLPTNEIANSIIDYLVVEEKQIHSNAVSFIRGRCWSAGGTQAENNMLVDKALSGTGSVATPGASIGMDKERAVLVRFRAGNDSRGRPVYLRKWWHLDVSALASTTITDPQLANTAQLTTAQRDAVASMGNDIKQITLTAPSGLVCNLVSENGRQITGDTIAHPYLEHHQLGDQWRG